MSDMGSNMFIMKFQSLSDLMKVKKGCPWMFDGNLVMLKDFDGFTSIKEMKFDKELFWVQIYNLSFGSMKKLVGEKGGSDLGSLPMVDVDENGIG